MSMMPPGDEEEEADRPVGVSPGYKAKKKEKKPYYFRGGYKIDFEEDVEVAPSFYSRHLDAPAAMSPTQVAEMQRKLVAAGLLSPKGFSLGVWDEPTRAAYKEVLAYANRAGITSAEEAMDRFVKSPVIGGAGGGSQRAPFTAELPNPDDVKAVIDSVVPNVLGRNLSDEEKNALATAYQQVVLGAQQAAYNAAETGGTVTQAPDMRTFAEKRAKELHPEEADEYSMIQQGKAFYNMIGTFQGGEE